MDIKIFSLENQKSKIYDRRTRKYFDEVYKSYATGCYRSATVMLWSVIVCDIIFKLQELRDLYADEAAKKILIEIEDLQKADPYSPKWEKELIKLVFERTQLLDTASNHKVMMIQENRHLSAHPVISNEDTLFEPTEEMVRSDIRNSIEVILCKPPFLTQKILSTILSDLEKIKDIFPDDKSLFNYLDAKYLKSLTSEIKIKIFRGLWKFAFKSEEEKAKENRDINIRALKLIFQKERTSVIQAINYEVKYYSSISNESETIKYLVEFIFLEREVYLALDDSAQELIKRVLLNNFSYFGIAFFISESPSKHLIKLTERVLSNLYQNYGGKGKFINKEHLSKLKSVVEEFSLEGEYRRFGIACFISSYDFERADMYFKRFIDPNLDKFEIEDFNVLLEGTNKNNQCYWRNRGKNESLKILQAAKAKMNNNFDFSVYENLPFDKIEDKIEEITGEV